jgi:hypothetical protein
MWDKKWSLPAWGAGLKLSRTVSSLSFYGRSPWGAWMKQLQLEEEKISSTCSRMGAWIETIILSFLSTILMSLPAWGVGLNLGSTKIAKPKRMSLPAWGAWIETAKASSFHSTIWSLPHGGVDETQSEKTRTY